MATNLVLKAPTNWTAVFFLGGLGLMHLAVYAMAVERGQSEAFMSLFFGVIFSAAALVMFLAFYEITVLPAMRHIRVRIGYRKCAVDRFIAFSEVRAVRVTLADGDEGNGGRIELLCQGDDLALPPTRVARVEALCLAVTLGVRLVKVYEGVEPLKRDPARRLRLPSSA
jgi:hypothetical protein